MKIIVTGGTGMVGAEVIRQAMADSDIESITAISRKPLTLQHPKLKTIIHTDYLKYDALKDVFKSNDAVVWCLGISQTQVNKQEYEVITFDYTIAAAKAMFEANPKSTFLFLSGAGADNTEKSRTLFARIKGKAENALMQIPLMKLFIARPAGIKPIHKNPNTSFFNKLAIPLFPLFEIISPSFVIASDVLARAMLRILKQGNKSQVIHNVELKEIGSQP